VRAFDRSYYPIHRFWEIDRTVALLILIPTVLLALFGVVRSFKGKQIPLWVVVLSVFWMGALWFGWYALGDEVAELILGAGALNGWFILNYIALRQSGTRSVDVSSAMGVLMLIAVLAVKPWAATVALSDYEDTVYIETYYDYAQTQPKEIQKKHKYKYYGTSRFYHENGMPEAIRIHDKQGREKHSEYFNTDGCLTKKDSVWFVEDAGLYHTYFKSWQYDYLGRRSALRYYRKGHAHGLHLDYYSNGSVRLAGRFEMDQPIGNWYLYAPATGAVLDSLRNVQEDDMETIESWLRIERQVEFVLSDSVLENQWLPPGFEHLPVGYCL